MAKLFIRNAIVILILFLLTFPYNYFYNHLSVLLNFYSYIPPILYALIIGAALMAFDLSNRLSNFVLFVLSVVIVILEIQFPMFAFGKTVFMHLVMTGFLFASTIKVKKC